ncbi:MAG: hypothetical protein ABUT20_30245, partial [Bacteroidota bacterium]
GGNISTSSSVSGIELRLLPPFIKNNNTPKVWPFPGYAKLYCIVIVVSDGNNQVVGGIDLQGFPRIDDEESLPTNKSIFYWQKDVATDKAPNQLHVFCSVIKSKESLRDTGDIMASLKDDAGYKDITTTLSGLATNATAAGAVINVITQLAGIVGKYLGNVEDKPLGTVINSYTVINGDFDTVGKNKYKYTTRNVDFEFDLVVRDNDITTAENKSSKSNKVEDSPAKETVKVDLMKIE